MSYDCLACGACCLMGYDVLLTPGEADYFTRVPHLMDLVREHRTFSGLELFFLKQREGGRCVALDGALGCVHCTIYEERPMLCREVEPGSDCCRESRVRFGLNPDGDA